MVTTAGKALFLRNVPTELVREAKAAAARRGQTLTAIVAEALTRSLGAEGKTQTRADDLHRDMVWYGKHRAKLLRRYRGEYVAIVDAAVVDHGRDFGALATRVFTRFGNRNIYMPRVQAGEATARVRSPRRSKR
jgi:plasmid stability protein